MLCFGGGLVFVGCRFVGRMMVLGGFFVDFVFASGVLDAWLVEYSLDFGGVLINL